MFKGSSAVSEIAAIVRVAVDIEDEETESDFVEHDFTVEPILVVFAQVVQAFRVAQGVVVEDVL